MSPDDLAAVLKEQRGVQILKRDGTPYQHLASEWTNARALVQKGIGAIKDRLGDLSAAGAAESTDAGLLRQKMGDMSRALDDYEAALSR